MPPLQVLHVDSFDSFDTAQILSRYDRTFNGAAIVPGAGRRGSAAFYLPGSAGGSVTKNLADDVNEGVLYVGGAFNCPNATSFDVSAGPALFHLEAMNGFGEVGSTLHLAIAPDGRLKVGLFGGIATTYLWMSEPGVLRYGQGYRYVELAAGLTLNPVTKRYDLFYYAVRADEALLVEWKATGGDHPPIGLGVVKGWTGVRWRAPGNVAMDDIYAARGPSPADGGEWLGDVSVLVLRPDGAGDVTDWTPDAASLAAGRANWEAVDETPAVDADYVTATLAGARDRYAFEDLPAALPADTPVLAVAVNVRAHKLDAGPRTVGATVSSGGTVADTTPQAVGGAPTVYQHVLMTDPHTAAAWTVAGVNALLAGPRLP